MFPPKTPICPKRKGVLRDTRTCMNVHTQSANVIGSQIIVTTAQPEHADQMEQVIRANYEIPADEVIDDLGAENFRSHMQIFPEGQFVALDAATRCVVGFSTNMRMQFDPRQPVLEPWLQTVDYG